MKSVRLVRESLKAKQGAKYDRYLRDYDYNVLSEELPLIYKYVAEGGPDFRAAFVKEVGGLVREIGTGPWPDLTVADRLKAYLAGEGRVEDFIALLNHQRDYHYSVPVKGLARPQADYPFLQGRPPVPAKILTLGTRERRVVSRLEQAAWSDGKLLLRGYALPGHLGAESRLGSRKMLIFREGGKRRRSVVSARTVASPMATVKSPHLALRHADWAGFTAVVDPSIFQSGGKWNEGIWTTSIAVTGAGGLHRARLRGGEHDTGQNPPPFWVAPDVRIVPAVSGALTIQVEIARARGLDARPVGDDAVEIIGELSAGVDAVRLKAVHVTTGTALDFPLETGAAIAGRTPSPPGSRWPTWPPYRTPSASPARGPPSRGASPSSAPTAPSTAWPTTSAAASTASSWRCPAGPPAVRCSSSAATPATSPSPCSPPRRSSTRSRRRTAP